jgi:DHA3 family macrolide efflux protein-like MFS transporter
MLLMGMAAALTDAPFMAIIQSVVAPALQGRVLTVLGSVTMGMAPLALLLAGPLADRIGVQSWYLMGAGAAAALAVYCWADPAVRQIEDHRP